MTALFRSILENELAKRHINMRDAAKEMGISHTTLHAAKDGKRKMDLDTALSIANWIGVPLSTLVKDADPEEVEKNTLFQAIRLVLDGAPELEQVFLEAAKQVDEGTLSLGDFKDIIEYAAYKIRIRKEQAEANELKGTVDAS